MNLKSACCQTKCNHLRPQLSTLPSPFFFRSKVFQKTRQHARVSKTIILRIIFQKWLQHLRSTCFPKSSFTCITPFDAELPVQIKSFFFKLNLKGIKQLLHPISPSCNSAVYNKEFALHYWEQHESHPPPERVCLFSHESFHVVSRSGRGRETEADKAAVETPVSVCLLQCFLNAIQRRTARAELLGASAHIFIYEIRIRCYF